MNKTAWIDDVELCSHLLLKLPTQIITTVAIFILWCLNSVQ